MTMRRSRSGLTLIEVVVATSIVGLMMLTAWRTIDNTADAKRYYEGFAQRSHELRMAMGRVVQDFESAYLSRNEDQNATNPRTMFIARPSSRMPEIRFSTLGHRVLWADANESEQTVISYLLRSLPEREGNHWIRREQRRLSNQHPDDEPAEYDVLLHDVESVKLEFFNWKNQEWQDSWDTTQSDGQRGWLPTRVKISITIKDAGGKDYTITSQARILMQEPLNFVQ